MMEKFNFKSGGTEASAASFSDDGLHRYELQRTWAFPVPRRMITFIGLNPSRADAEYNDRTITRCIEFARSWGFDGMWFTNLYSFRTPYVNGPLLPKHIKEGWEPLIENLDRALDEKTNSVLKDIMQRSDKIVCCWGSWPFISTRAQEVLQFIEEPYCFGVNSDGSPKHPLYLKATTTLQRYQ